MRQVNFFDVGNVIICKGAGRMLIRVINKAEVDFEKIWKFVLVYFTTLDQLFIFFSGIGGMPYGKRYTSWGFFIDICAD